MATFNPQIQDAPDPEWLRQSKGISTPESDKTWATVFKGIGDIIEVGAKGGDAVVKDYIDRESRAAVDYEREGLTGAMEQANALPASERVADYQVDKSILGPDSAPAPANVEAGLNTAARIVNAGPSSASKLDPVYYEGRLALAQKDLRRQAPGYADYIDQRMVQLTGENPANAYWKHLMARANTAMTSGQATLKRDQGLVDKEAQEGNPTATMAMDKVNSGEWSTSNGKLTKWIVDSNKLKWQKTEATTQLELSNATNSINAQTADASYLKVGTDLVNSRMVTLFDGMGPVSLDEMGKMVQRIQRGEIPTNDAEQLKLAMALRAYRDQTANELHSWANTPTKNGSVAYLLKEEGVGKRDKQIFAAVDQMISAIESKDTGTAYRNAKALDASKHDTAMAMWNSTNTSVASWSRIQGAATTIGGPNGANLLFPANVANGLRPGLEQVINSQIGKLAVQSPEFTGPQPYSLKQAVQELKKAGVGIQTDPNTPDPTKASDGQAYRIVIEAPSKITNPELATKIKQNIINGSYGPENDKLIEEFAKDQLVDGQPVAGQTYVFKTMTTDAITKEVWKQSDGNRNLWDNYRGWAELTHGKIFGNNIRDMNTLADDPRVKFMFNPNTHHIDIQFTNPTGRYPSLEKNYVDQLNFYKNNINSGIDSIANISRTERGNDNAVNPYVLNLLTAQNLDLSKGLGLKMLQAIMASNPPAKKEAK